METAAAAYVITAFNIDHIGCLHGFVSSRTTKLVAIRMSLVHRGTLDRHSTAVILTNLPSALLQFSGLDQAELPAREFGQLCRAMESEGWALALH